MFLLMQWETKKWVRGSGVTRDVYSSFWNEAYESLFIGRDDRVPLVRHDFFINEWNAIGKIIYKGYVDSSYFPMLISKSFLMLCTIRWWGIVAIFRYVEFLDQFKCRTMVTVANVKVTLIELAIQELIQKPHMMGSCWKKYLMLLPSYDSFIEMTWYLDSGMV